MLSEFCVRSEKTNIKETACKICKKGVPDTCLQDHEKICKRSHECVDCGVILTASSQNSLKVLIKKHLCHSKLCKGHPHIT